MFNKTCLEKVSSLDDEVISYWRDPVSCNHSETFLSLYFSVKQSGFFFSPAPLTTGTDILSTEDLGQGDFFAS